ncbi:hypothetical protein MMPV_006390 [Pyropia vietnamensis]
MGMILGKITVETPSHTVLRTAADGAYEIRQYGSLVAAEVHSTDWATRMTEREFSKVAFPTLARYIGVFGEGENVARGGKADAAADTANPADAGADAPTGAEGDQPEKMAMTAPVIMAATDDATATVGDSDKKPEKMAMTAPVVMSATDDGASPAGGRPEKMAMTAPVVTGGGNGADSGDATASSGDAAGGFTMAFLLPSKYKAAAEAPRPTNDKVHLVDVPPRTVAVRKYTGNTTMRDCGEQVKGLLDALFRDGVATTGPWTLQRYNPPFSLPWTKTNEIHVPVEEAAVADAGAAEATAEGGDAAAAAAAVPA